MNNLKALPPNERPREKLISRGADCLSDIELLAIILGSGNKQLDVFSLASAIIATIDAVSKENLYTALTKQRGIGQAKACLITAALEFCRRRIRPQGVKIKEARDVIPLVSHLSDRAQEHFLCISLNGAHEVIASRVVTIGLLNSCQIHPREVLADPIGDRAASIIIAHNHPSGELIPSKEDMDITRRIKQSAELLGIKLLDQF